MSQNMVKKHILGNTYKAGEFNYERADEEVNNKASLYLYKWTPEYEQVTEKENYLLKKLFHLADYMDTAFDDQYVKNLYYQYVNGFVGEKPFTVILKEMESTRRSFVNALKRKDKNQRPNVKTKYVYDGKRLLKWKLVIRLLTAQHLAELLYKQYRRQLKLSGKAVPERESLQRTIPGMTAWYIYELMPDNKKSPPINM
jgi:hypothetical protein